jgi:hypothetical protein
MLRYINIAYHINHSSTNNCTIGVNCRSLLPYICFGHYVTIIRGIYIYLCMHFTTRCPLCVLLMLLYDESCCVHCASSEVRKKIYIDTPDDGHIVTETYVG